MTIKVRLPETEEEWNETGEEFDRRSLARALAGGPHETEAAARFPLSRLYAFANYPDPAADPELARALSRDNAVALLFREVAGRVGMAPALAAAAHDTELRERAGEGWSLHWKSSAAEPEQAYVVLELKQAGAMPRALLLLDTTTGRYLPAIRLTQVHDGQGQAVVDMDSDAIRALRNPDYEVQPV